MSIVLAAFPSPEAFTSALHRVREHGVTITDAFTPFPVEGVEEFLPDDDRGVRSIILGTGFVVAGLAYLLEWWTAVISFPFHSGNRPLHSWPVFVLFPFELGILAAAIAGLVVFFWRTGLPRYYDPIFGAALVERANVDRFVLAVEAPSEAADKAALMTFLMTNGADAVSEVER